MIKQIQLRGISRTPSDRMSEDGGLSESLNMYLDTAENAPVFVPEDVTTKLGLPPNLQAESIFIHKTASHENYIVVQEGRIVAYTPGIEDEEPLLVMELTDSVKVVDISSIGNTLLIATESSLYYSLWKGDSYVLLGDQVPFPEIAFYQVELKEDALFYYADEYDTEIGDLPDSLTDVPRNDNWKEPDIVLEPKKNRYLEYLWEQINLFTNAKDYQYVHPVFVRYVVTLYDGSKLSSIPVLLGAGDENPLKIEMKGTHTTQSGNEIGKFETTVRYHKPIYNIRARMLSDWEINDWKDIISSLDFYVSADVPWNLQKEGSYIEDYKENTITVGTKTTLETSGTLRFLKNDKQFKDDLLFASSDMYLIESIPMPDATDKMTKLVNAGLTLNDRPKDFRVLQRLEQDDMQHFKASSLRLGSYNNSPILISPTWLLEYHYPRLNAHYKYKVNAIDFEGSKQVQYETMFRIITADGVKFVSAPKDSTYTLSYTGIQDIAAFQIFPDSRCDRIYIKATITDSNGKSYLYGQAPMQQHPYLNCAYLYLGLDKSLLSFCKEEGSELPLEDAMEHKDSSLFLGDINNPFSFPLNRRYTFQSKVLGVAIATTALSQGQFGQFPLYVFTEDGIWAMETAADGSFVSQKPFSREVCINPDSICSIDNAVVFVTAKAVMMVQGSQVMNISPYMNGRHYTPNESALNIIGKQDGYDTFVDVISDEDPFMSFMKDAKVAYDYTGQRLIFISPANKGFQYVYKIDTQTWHKMSFDGPDLNAPLNSYPECLVQAVRHGQYIVPNPPDPDFKEEWAEQTMDLVRQGWQDGRTIPDIFTPENFYKFIIGELGAVEVKGDADALLEAFDREGFACKIYEKATQILSLSTVLDASTNQDTAKGILITRPFDLGMPDVYKSITSIKIRGDFDKGNVKYILQGSNDGRTFYTLNTLRGKSWRMFRIFILADLEPTERISWIDVDFEPRYNTKLR